MTDIREAPASLESIAAQIEAMRAELDAAQQRVGLLELQLGQITTPGLRIVLAGAEEFEPRRGTDGAAAYDIYTRAIVDADAPISPEEPWRPAKADFIKYEDYLQRVDPNLRSAVVDDPQQPDRRYAIMLEPGQELSIGPGFICDFDFPMCYLVQQRSGLAKRGIHITSGSVIDADFRGEIAIRLKNDSNESFRIERKMRLAQILFIAVARPNVRLVHDHSDLSPTNRGAGGHGSTGLH